MAGNNIFTDPRAIEQPESRGYVGEDVKTRVFYVHPKEAAPELLPENGLIAPDGWYYERAGSSIVNMDAYAKVTLSFVRDIDRATRESISAQRKEGVDEYSLQINYMEKPLETSPNYRVRWNYDLYQSYSQDSSLMSIIPAWWETATEQSDTIASIDYRWAKTQPPDFVENDKNYSWMKICDRTKPGVEAYQYPQPVVVASRFFKKKRKALQELANKIPGTRATPKELFDLPADVKYWLYQPSGLYPDGDYWVLKEEYLYVDNEWDGDIYATSG